MLTRGKGRLSAGRGEGRGLVTATVSLCSIIVRLERISACDELAACEGAHGSCGGGEHVQSAAFVSLVLDAIDSLVDYALSRPCTPSTVHPPPPSRTE